jgi:aminoglycoside 6'-N-acetyltransferase I
MNMRPVTPADQAVWLSLRQALWPDTPITKHQDEMAAFFAQRAREPLAVLLAVGDRDQAIGFVELSVRAYAEGCDTQQVAYVEGWYVVPECRGQGVGRALIQAAEDWGRSQGCTELASDAEADNEVSRLAHGAVGFTDVGLVRCFRKDL